MKKIYLKFYELQTRTIEKTQLNIDDIKDDLYIVSDQSHIKLKPNILIGRLDHKRNFGFLRQEVKDIYIEKEDLLDAMHDDIVFVQDGHFPKVVYIIKRALDHLVVTAHKKKDGWLFQSDNYIDRQIDIKDTSQLVDGQVCLIEVINIEPKKIEGHIERIIGHKNDPDIETLKIVSTYQWPQTFKDELIDEVYNIKIDFEQEKKERLDLTHQNIITIDGADAKDLDDAIGLEIIGDTYHLGVHIADVSHYVRPQTLLDAEAFKRSTSAYLADRVIPMLPHKLSNDWCSLNPHEPKLTLSCLMVLDKDGHVISYDIKKTIIESKRRMTYHEVNQFLNEGISLKDEIIESMLIHMNELSQKLSIIRKKRGEIEFETSEIGFIVDDQGIVKDVYEHKQDLGENLIESMMLIANETVAFHMHHAQLPSIYRIHEKPDADKLRNALETVKQLGFPVNFKNLGNPKPLQIITNQTADSPYATIVHNLILRAMQKAKYSHVLDIHYGLGARYYTHFTSPIRRYPDLILHRLIHTFVLGETKHYKQDYAFYEANLPEIAMHTSDQERKAIQMERDVAKLKSCEYMSSRVGLQFKAMITQMMPSGMFVKLENGIEGFVPLSLMNDYFIYDKSLLSFMSKNKTSYRLGDQIKVELVSVDMMDKKMDFKIISKKPKKGVRHHENHRSKQKGKA